MTIDKQKGVLVKHGEGSRKKEGALGPRDLLRTTNAARKILTGRETSRGLCVKEPEGCQPAPSDSPQSHADVRKGRRCTTTKSQDFKKRPKKLRH